MKCWLTLGTRSFTLLLACSLSPAVLSGWAPGFQLATFFVNEHGDCWVAPGAARTMLETLGSVLDPPRA